MAPATKPQVIIDERLRQQIGLICSSQHGSCGIIIGQLDGGRHSVTHFVRATKAPSDSAEVVESDEWFQKVQEDGDENDIAGGEKQPAAWRFARERAFCPMSDVKDLNSARLPSLAVQISRLLPGGLQVLGIFFTSSGEVPKTARPRLREILGEISTATQKDCPVLAQDVTVDEKLILAFEPRSSAVVTSLCLDAADSKSIIKPITVAFQHLDWVEIQTRFRVDLEKPTDLKNRDVEGILKRVSEGYADLVRNSVCLVNDQFLDSDRPLPTARDSVVRVGFLIPFASSSPDDGFAEMLERNHQKKSGRLAFQADIVGRAYLHAKASVGFAVQAIKNDLLRSMTTRMELHCEDFLVTDTDEQEFDVVHELARRILAPLSDTGITFSSYLHENDEVRDSLGVFVGLLDMSEQLSTSDLLTTVEKIPNPEDVDSALESVSTHSGEMELDISGEETVSSVAGVQAKKLDEPAERGHLQTSAIVMAVVFAVVFVLYQLYLFTATSSDGKKATTEL